MDRLTEPSAPLLLSDAPDFVRASYSAFALVASADGVLIQMIIASRVLHGRVDRGQLPTLFAKLSPLTRRPTYATFCVAVTILAVTLASPIKDWAECTSHIVLGVFVLVNLSLIRLKQSGQRVGAYFKVPMRVPVIGVATSALLLLSGLFIG